MGGHGRAPLGSAGSQPPVALSPCRVWAYLVRRPVGWGRSAGAWWDGHVSGGLEIWRAGGYQGEPQQCTARVSGSQGS